MSDPSRLYRTALQSNCHRADLRPAHAHPGAGRGRNPVPRRYLPKGHRSQEVSPVIPFSVLDLSPICQGATAADAFRYTLDLARNAERLGYERYWLAEHHNMPGIASAATSVVIGHVAAGTKTIRVGSGGVMLPNHAPLVIAEQFGTLASLFPGRIEVGLGRAPGTDQATVRALRRDPMAAADRFPDDVL